MSKKPGSSAGSAKVPSSTSRAWDALTPALSDWILEAVYSMGFARMTPVQASTIPLFLGNKDPVVEAVTGSGKTLAFLIPIVERLLKLEDQIRKHHVGAIIISPTRELATQIHAVLLQLLAFHAPSATHMNIPETQNDQTNSTAEFATDATPYSSLAPKIIPQLLLGGNQTPQADLAQFLQKCPNLITSTPGRLIELLSSPYVHTPQSSFQVLVMDEADRLLDMGFQDTLQKILVRLPKQRRTGLFSASISDAVERLVKVGIQNPYRINVKVRGAEGQEDSRTPASLSTHYITTSPSHKLPTLVRLLNNLNPAPHRAIAYLPTCALVDYLHAILPSILPPSTTKVLPLHGKLTQAHRQLNLTNFTDSPTPALLLTTDLASRGLDIPAVDLTVQLDPPTNPSSYLHRAGRAARAGRPGLSVLFLLPGRESDEYPAFLSIRKTPVTPLPASFFANSTPLAITLEAAQETTHALRTKVMTDRSLHEKGQRALPGYVQAYRKHVASSIFRVGELPWRDLADAWGLLRLPKMPEVRKSGYKGGLDLGLKIDWDAYGYRDKKREQMRKEKLDAPPTGDGDAEVGGKAGVATITCSSKGKKRKEKAWTRNTAIADEKEERRERKKRKRDAERVGKLDGEQRAERTELEEMIAKVRATNASEMGAKKVENVVDIK